MTELLVALTFDVDNDFCRHPREQTTLAWRGLDRGIRVVLDVLAAAEDDHGLAMPASWFVRVDRQIEAMHGAHRWVADRLRAAVGAELAARGHELAWHPHLVHHRGGSWQLELDPIRQRDQLTEAHAAATAAGVPAIVSRIGEAVFSTAIAATLDELDVIADSTALPDRVADDGHFDWRGAPRGPYRVAPTDYRRPAARGLLQLPFTMLRCQAPYDDAPLARYANLGFVHDVIAAPLRAHAATAPLLIAVSHPFELLGEARHPLWGSSPANLRANLDTIMDAATVAGRTVRFVTMAQLARLCATDEGKQRFDDTLGATAVHQRATALG